MDDLDHPICVISRFSKEGDTTHGIDYTCDIVTKGIFIREK